MNRNELITQVKQGYGELASMENRDTFTDMDDIAETPEKYYEKLLGQVIDEINKGKFDTFNSGQEIIEAVANNKAKWLGQDRL